MMLSQRFVMKGFTLIEVMIVVAIVGILAAIAYPSYQEYVMRSNRSEGMAMLNDAAARQERYFAQSNTYVTSNSDIGKLNMRSSSASEITSDTGKYTLSVGSVASDGGYTLTAEQKFGDTKCGNLTLNALGAKGRSGSGKSVEECWR